MTLTAHQLARQLLQGPDLPVHFAYDYGDRSHTLVAPGVECVTEAVVTHSDYHSEDKLVYLEDESGRPEDAVLMEPHQIEAEGDGRMRGAIVLSGSRL